MPDECTNLEYLSLSEVANLVGKTKRQIQDLVDRKHLPATKVEGRWLVSMADLQAQGFKQSIRSGLFLDSFKSSSGQPDFLNLSMQQIIDLPKSGHVVDPGFKRPDPVFHEGSTMHFDFCRKDGSRLAIDFSRMDGQIAANLVRTFLGG